MSGLLQRAQRILRAKLAALAAAHPRHEFVGESFEPGRAADPDGQGGAGVGRAAAVERARALAVLELTPGTTPDEVRSAYRRLCRSYHPDRFANDDAKSRAAHELFVEIQAAYELLTAPESSA